MKILNIEYKDLNLTSVINKVYFSEWVQGCGCVEKITHIFLLDNNLLRKCNNR